MLKVCEEKRTAEQQWQQQEEKTEQTDRPTSRPTDRHIAAEVCEEEEWQWECVNGTYIHVLHHQHRICVAVLCIDIDSMLCTRKV